MKQRVLQESDFALCINDDVDPVPDIVWDGGEGGGIAEDGQQPGGGGLVVLREHLALVPAQGGCL